MKFAKVIVLLLSVLMLSGVFVFSAKAATFPNLPTSPVNVKVTSGIDVYPLSVLLSGVGTGFDVSNQAYTGFCVDLLTLILPDKDYVATLKSSLSLATPWDKINYVLNHQGSATARDIQAAIWLVEGFTAGQIQTYADFTPSAAAIQLANDANAYGAGYVPGAGGIVAVWCDVTNGQDLLIELKASGFEGLTPGFWKNHLSLWQGYSPTDKFNAVFGVSITIDGNSNPTLLQALQAKGGIVPAKGVYDALARQAVAALLNANHQYINYPLNDATIRSLVKNAITSGGAQGVAGLLEGYNSLEGGIDAHGNPV